MSEIKPIHMIPYLYAVDMPDDVVAELDDASSIKLYGSASIFTLCWNDAKLPLLKQWLVSTYGSDIYKHKRFGLCPF